MSIKNNTTELQEVLEALANKAAGGEQATPVISVASNGLITATAGVKTSTHQLTTQAAKTVTPTKSSQTAVASGVYTTGAVTVAAIPSQYITTTDATASADEIMSGETAYVNGSKVTGTFSIDSELSAQDGLIAQIQSVVNSLPEAGGDPTLQDKTVSPSTSKQTITADSGYDGLGTVTVNAMATATQATPSITVSSGGLITASATQTAGYVSSGTKSATKQLTTQAAQTITPGTTNKTIASGRYLTGTQTIKGDSNLVAENIKSGVSIFGVNGSYAGSGGSGGGDHSMEDGLISRTITHYENDRVTSIGEYVFQYNDFLTSVSFSECRTINSCAFYMAWLLESANFPKCTAVGWSAFNGTSLVTINLPECTTIAQEGFASTFLDSINLPKCTSIGLYAFGASNLTSITLGAPTVCTLDDIDAFEDTDITPTTGYIYVPASLVNSYKTATNWSYFANRIFAIPDSSEPTEPEIPLD